MRQKVKLFDNKIDLKLYKLIIMEKAQLCSTTKGQRAITFNNFMYQEERTFQLLGRVTWRCPFNSCKTAIV